ncbi:MAG: hypothetical protein K5767_05390 [Clostridia bacterium]|nr:hypothetical protein [Clostridia bacterium]
MPEAPDIIDNTEIVRGRSPEGFLSLGLLWDYSSLGGKSSAFFAGSVKRAYFMLWRKKAPVFLSNNHFVFTNIP